MTLNNALLAAHTDQDGSALVRLYTLAADQTEDKDAACFYLTQAYIYALESGDPTATKLYGLLKAQARV